MATFYLTRVGRIQWFMSDLNKKTTGVDLQALANWYSRKDMVQRKAFMFCLVTVANPSCDKHYNEIIIG